jgi:hypothetical protein
MVICGSGNIVLADMALPRMLGAQSSSSIPKFDSAIKETVE